MCLFTPQDLSICGWRYRVSEPHTSTAILGQREVKQSEIKGALVRLPWVGEEELLDIVPDDKAYVAAEMSAFLLCWLSGLTCPVLNRPTPGCLNGPGWGPERWTVAASNLGMRIQPVRRRVSLSQFNETPVESAVTTVTVVGKRCFGHADETLLVLAQRLADAANVDLLGVQFSGPEDDAYFIRATTCPEISAGGIESAVLTQLGSN